MNSLLQSLYMTPEFRRALYSWSYNKEKDGPEEHSIPLQLQRLFGTLQLSKSRNVDTRALTKSFGWDSGEARHLHTLQIHLQLYMQETVHDTAPSPLPSGLPAARHSGALSSAVRRLGGGLQGIKIHLNLFPPKKGLRKKSSRKSN